MAKKPPKAQSNGAAKPAGEPALKACYVLSLEVENVRCFGPKQKLDLSNGKGGPAQWTIVLGENGTGKTTLLQILTSFQVIEQTWPYIDQKHKTLLPIFHLIANQAFNDNKGWLGGPRNGNISAEASCRLSFLESPYGLHSDLSRSGLLTSLWRHSIFSQASESDMTGLRYYGYGAGRQLKSIQQLQANNDLSVATLIHEDAPLRNAEDWLLRLDYAMKTRELPADAEWLEKVKHLLISILPDINDLRFQTTTGPNPRQWVEFLTFSGWVPLPRLGYGYQTQVAWVLDFVSRMVERYPDRPDPLKEPAIVIVDEIDLHLHPRWQRQLIGDLTKWFPNTQFIVTAHSPLIVQAVEDANIVVLKRVGDHVEIINDPDQVRGWGVDQILTSNLFDLKSARPRHVEELLTREQELLAKSKLTKAEQRELKVIQDKIEKLPVGNNAQSTKEMKAIRDALDLLMKNSPP